MTTSIITGTVKTSVSLTTAAFTNPVTLSKTGVVITAGIGVLAKTNSWNINNLGYIHSLRNFGVVLLEGGSVTNAAGARIIGYGGIAIKRASGTVTNAGVIFAAGIGDAGIGLWNGGSVTNAAHASIYSGVYAGVYGGRAATAIDNLGTVTGFQFGVVFRDGGTVTNTAGASINSLTDIGVYLTGRALCNINNAGSISGSKYGVFLGDGGGSVTNATGGSIKGLLVDGIHAWGPSTVANSGTITGLRDAVYFQGTGANRLVVHAGAVFNGAVKASAGSNTIELASSASAGTLKGLGAQYLGFQTLTIDSGAAWTIAGAKTSFPGVTIGGFNSKDALDLTGLPFAAGDNAAINGSGVLSVTNAGGVVLATAHLSGSFTGVTFAVASDGAGGIKVTESATGSSHIAGGVGIDLAAGGAVTNAGSNLGTAGEAGLNVAGGMITNSSGGLVKGAGIVHAAAYGVSELTRLAEAVAAYVGPSNAASNLSMLGELHNSPNHGVLAPARH